MDPLARLQASIDQTHPIVASIPTSDYGNATPCEGWNVTALLNHMISALIMFRDAGDLGAVDPATFATDQIGADASHSFETAGKAAVAAWSSPGKVDGMANLPFGEFPAAFALQLPAMDMVVHGWDLAKATGQSVDWNAALVADTLRFCEATFTNPEMRGHDFAPPVAVSADADELTRLIALMGRQSGRHQRTAT